MRMLDIAERVGVSRPVVSAVLNGTTGNIRVSAETRARILATATEMGYRPNQLARAMVGSGKLPVVVYLAKNPEKEFRARMLTQILTVAGEAGYFVQVIRLFGRELDGDLINRCLQLRPSGIIAQLIDPVSLVYLQAEMEQEQIPVLLVDTSVGAEMLDRVASDEMQAALLAVDYLARLGHRRIVFINGIKTDPVSQVREDAFRKALDQYALPNREEYVQYGNWEPEDTRQVTVALLQWEQEHRPTAIFCANDVMAMVVQRTARQQGFPVPERLSVVGYGDYSTSAYTDPPITSIHQPFEEIGKRAMTRLLERIQETAPMPVSEELLACRLVVRESCQPPAW